MKARPRYKCPRCGKRAASAVGQTGDTIILYCEACGNKGPLHMRARGRLILNLTDALGWVRQRLVTMILDQELEPTIEVGLVLKGGALTIVPLEVKGLLPLLKRRKTPVKPAAPNSSQRLALLHSFKNNDRLAARVVDTLQKAAREALRKEKQDGLQALE